MSDSLDVDARAVLGLDRLFRGRGITEGHRAYLPWYRERVLNAHLPVHP